MTEKIIQRIEDCLDMKEGLILHTLHLLYGELPVWVPLPTRQHARRLIDKMFYDGFTPEQIAQFVDDEIADSLIVPGTALDSLAFIQTVNELAHIRYAVSLDEEEGLLLLAGEKAVKGVGFSSGGTPKKGKEYEPKASIRKICAKIQSHKFDDVLDSLRGEDSEIAEQCKDWYESTSDPIGVLFTGVDDKEEVISYLSRGELPDAQKQLTFRSLRNILSRIKKPKP